MAPRPWHPSNGTHGGTQQWHPSNGTQQWHPAMAPSNGWRPAMDCCLLFITSRPQRLAFLMLRSAADLCRCNKPRLPSQKTLTDANNPPCRSQKPCHCRKKPPRHCRKKPPTPTVAKNPPTNPPSQKTPVTDAKNPKPCILGLVTTQFLWNTRNATPAAKQAARQHLQTSRVWGYSYRPGVQAVAKILHDPNCQTFFLKSISVV